MSELKYHVSHDGQELGPFSMNEIISQLNAGELTVMDYIYDDGKADWVAFVEHQEVMSLLKAAKPKAPPKQEAQPDPEPQVPTKESSVEDGEWYVLKGENKFGPFSYFEMVKMLQEKLIFEFDFVWKSGMESWARVAETQDFASDTIQNLKTDKVGDVSDLFFRRRHKRSQYNGTLIVHDNNKVWKGQALEISAGGAGVVMQNAMIVPGDVLYLHFKPCDGVPPFNAICEVVSKKYVEKVKGEGTPIRYGMKFTQINEADQKTLFDYTQKSKAA